MGDANINNQITLSRRICKVVDDFEVPALEARALGDSLRLDLAWLNSADGSFSAMFGKGYKLAPLDKFFLHV